MNKFRLCKLFFSFILLIFLTGTSHSQNAIISGIITDKDNNIPIEDVVVSIEKSNAHTHTNIHGEFSFIHLPPGNYQIDFNKLGYEKQQLEIEVNESKNEPLHIRLVFHANTLSPVSIETAHPVSAASSSYLSKLYFETRPKNSAQDMLRLVPGLFIAQHAGGGKAEQIFVRGFDCDHGTDVAAFVDGIPVNMPSHGHGQGYADLHFLIPETIETMDIFKGTSSPYYGNFATGAAVNFKTFDSLPSNSIQLESGSVPTVNTITSGRLLAMLKGPVQNKRLASYFALDAINNRGYFEKNQHFKRLNLFSKLVWSINDNSHIQFSVSGFGTSWDASGQIPERAVSQGQISRFGSIDPNEGGTTQRTNYNLTYSTKSGQNEFKIQTYLIAYRFKLFSNFTFFREDTVQGDMIEQDDNRLVKGLNTRYAVPHHFFGLKNKLILGASFRADDIENQLWHAPKRVRVTSKAHALIHERSNSAYINEVFLFNSHFRMEAGLRYDYFIFDVEDILPTDSSHTNYSGYTYQSAFHPKLNCIYSAHPQLQFFLNGGTGFHSNDARAVVQDKTHQLPLAISAEIGTLFHIKKSVLSAAIWTMDLSNELVYTGDDGTTENKGSSRRTGIDISGKIQLLPWLFVDMDINFAKCRLTDTLLGNIKKTDFYIPLAPSLTSAGGITVKPIKTIESTIRYRYMKSRPANESSTIIAAGYQVIDFSVAYRFNGYKIGIIIENLFNTKWNEAQFATESRLPNEMTPVDELHFTPGTPFYAKLTVGCSF